MNFCHWLTRHSDSLNILSCVCERGPYHDWCHGKFSSHISSAVSSSVGIWPFVVLFYKVRDSTPWPFGNLSRTLIRSWGLHSIDFFQNFQRELQIFLKNFIVLSAQAGLEVSSRSYKWYWILSPGYLFLQPLCPCCGLVGLFFVPWFPLEKGIQRSWKSCLTIAINVPRSLLPDYCSRHPLRKTVLRGCLPFFPIGFIL